MKNLILSLFILPMFLTQSLEAFPVVPLPEMTTGALCSKGDPDFAGYRYKARVAFCKRNVSREDRQRIYDRYNIPPQCRGRYTVDHFYPLSIGGNNNSKNLWPEHRNVKNLRFDLEQEVFDQVANGNVKQEDALRTIREAKLNPPVEKLRPGNDPCDRPDLIFSVIQNFVIENQI